MSQIVLHFLHSTSVLLFHIDIVLALFIGTWSINFFMWEQCIFLQNLNYEVIGHSWNGLLEYGMIFFCLEFMTRRACISTVMLGWAQCPHPCKNWPNALQKVVVCLLCLECRSKVSLPNMNIRRYPPYQYRKSHCGDKTVLRTSYLHDGISYTGTMASLYWIRAQDFKHSVAEAIYALAPCITRSSAALGLVIKDKEVPGQGGGHSLVRIGMPQIRSPLFTF